MLLLPLAFALAFAHADAVNRVVGDASAVGVDVDDLDEVERIQLHLRYVSALLRAHEPVGLTAQQRQRRARALDDLAVYVDAGEFPRRTDDEFVGRRPRFIDDRGVHCAVGQLMKDAGDDDLARAVDDEFEYAYVDDIDDDRVADWAAAHGFTIEELAMIQPSYDPPPSPAEVKRDLVAAADAVGLACAATLPWQDSVVVDVDGDDRGVITFAAAGDASAFAKCVVDNSPAEGGGAWMGKPKPFHFRLTLTPKSPSTQFKNALATLKAPNETCRRRPGALVGKVKVRAASDVNGLRIAVETEPQNDEVRACLQETVERVLAPFSKGKWMLKNEVSFTLRSGLSVALEQNLPHFLRAASGRCSDSVGSPPQPLPKKVRARVRAAVDAAAFDVEVEATPKNVAFLACMKEKVSADLEQYASTQLKDQRFFRIDEAVDVRGEGDVETAADQEKRLRDLMIRVHQDN